MPTQTQQSESLAYSQLRDEITRQLEEFKKQQALIQLFQSDLDLLKKQYELSPSRFTQAAQWYQQHSWYQKLVLKAEVAVLALSLGILINGLALILIASSCFTLIYLFDDHNKAEKQRRDTLCNNIIQLEKELQVNIESFSQLQSKFLELCQATQEQQSALASCFAAVSQESLQLQAQIKLLIEASSQHTQYTQALDTQVDTFTEQIGQQQARFQQAFDKASSTLLEQQTSDGTTALSITTINQDVSRLEQAITRLDQALSYQEQLVASQTTRCDDLAQTISQATQIRVELSEEIASHQVQSSDETQSALAQSEQVLQQSSSVQEKARLLLERRRTKQTTTIITEKNEDTFQPPAI